MPGMLRISTALVSRYEKFESISLQQTVRLSREVARRGREPRLFARMSGPWEVVRSAETGIGRRHGTYWRHCLSWAKFQYRSARAVFQGGCSPYRPAMLRLAQPVKRSRAPSVARARAADASAPTACPQLDRAAGARRGWLA